MSPSAKTREGVCLMICEIMWVPLSMSVTFTQSKLVRENTTDGQREGHEDDVISIIRVSLVDDEANVRSAAAKAFDVLQNYMGVKAIDQTIPTLLEALRQPGKGSGTALQALREIMAVRINKLPHYLQDHLTDPTPNSRSVPLPCSLF